MKRTSPIMQSYARNPHARFDEGEVAPCTAEASLRRVPCRRQPEGCASGCATPRRGSLLCKQKTMKLSVLGVACCFALGSALADGGTVIRHLEDTYLQSDGTQYIDLDYYANPNTRVEITFEPITTNGTRYVFGSASSSGSDFQEGLYVQNGNLSFVCGDVWGSSFGLATGTKATRSRFTAILDVKGASATLKSGSSQVWTKEITSTRTKTGNLSMLVFARRHTSSEVKDYMGMKLYSMSVYDDDALVRDLVPYGRGAVTGLLDRVSGKVFAKAGGNDFILGTDDAYIASDRTKNGGQWFDTGYHVNPNTKIEVDFALLDTLTTQQRIFGTPGNDHDGLVCALYVNGGKNFAYTSKDDSGTGWWRATGVPADTERHVFTLDNPNSTMSLTDAAGKVLFGEDVSTTRTKTEPFPLRLFGGSETNGTGGVKFNNACSVRIYRCRIWDGATLVRDYSPRLQDNIAGFHDAVSDSFTSIDPANKTHSLRAGGAIECTSAFGQNAAVNGDAYIEGTGSQYFETDYCNNEGTKIGIDFAPSQLGGTKYWFGGVAGSAWATANGFGLYYQRNNSNGNDNLVARYWASSSETKTSNLSTSTDIARYKAVVDIPGKTTALFSNGIQLKNNTVGNFATITTNTVPLCIMYAQNQNNGIAIGRIYSFEIYENGELKRSYFPTMQGGVAGLWDSVNKAFIANANSVDGSGFTLHGAGAGGSGMEFTEHPQSCSVSYGESTTLSAFAPGAVGYLWLKNGEIIEGAKGRTLEVAYSKGGKIDTYQCLAHYNLFGYGLSNPASVESVPKGLVIIVQ